MSKRLRVVVPTLFGTLVLGSAVLSGCGGDSGGTPAAATSGAAEQPTSSSAPAPAETSTPATSTAPFQANTDPDLQDASADARVTVRNIRVGRHEGFDQVVLDLGGKGTPGWDVRYVDEARSQGSGKAVDVPGDAVLQVSITGAGYPYDTGVDEFAGGPVSAAGTKSVTEVVFDNTFEGTTVAFVGVRAKAPFRVYSLQNPPRVVIEVRDPQ